MKSDSVTEFGILDHVCWRRIRIASICKNYSKWDLLYRNLNLYQARSISEDRLVSFDTEIRKCSKSNVQSIFLRLRIGYFYFILFYFFQIFCVSRWHIEDLFWLYLKNNPLHTG
jgi:hypothetical protein